jgi:hypothetical protein
LIALIINAHPSAEVADRPKAERHGALTKRPDHSEKNPAPKRLRPVAIWLPLLCDIQANPLFTMF